ncbi:MAG: hypothetical protein Q7K55_00975 [Candidatus Levybacteria bacterium]|nr:hypothetical protein [Candidatus Levybacteria bacterium]
MTAEMEKLGKETKLLDAGFALQAHSEIVGIPVAAELIVAEREALSKFFGKDILIPEPPDRIFKILERFYSSGIRGLEPHYWPGQTFKKKDQFPGWNIRPKEWFWQRLKEGSVEENAATIEEGWYIIDHRPKPDYDEGLQLYKDDYLAPTIQSLRNKGLIQTYRSVPEASRFAISPIQIERLVLPAFAQSPELEDVMTGNEIRNKKYIEFNIWGNIFHPKWGQTNTWEWFADKVFGGSYRLIGGNSEFGGFTRVDCSWSDDHSGHAGFSPIMGPIKKE